MFELESTAPQCASAVGKCKTILAFSRRSPSTNACYRLASIGKGLWWNLFSMGIIIMRMDTYRLCLHGRQFSWASLPSRNDWISVTGDDCSKLLSTVRPGQNSVRWIKDVVQKVIKAGQVVFIHVLKHSWSPKHTWYCPSIGASLNPKLTNCG